MVDTEVHLPGGHTFVVRIWREAGAGHPQWRGRIEHVQSGKQRAFLRLAEMLEFIEGFATLAQGEAGQGEE